MGSRYLSDVQLTHLYKWRAAELPGTGRQRPHCHQLSCTFPCSECHGVSSPPASSIALPQCPLLVDVPTNSFKPDISAAKSNNMCPLYTSSAPLPNISSLHQDQHHFHANCHCHGNYRKRSLPW